MAVTDMRGSTFEAILKDRYQDPVVEVLDESAVLRKWIESSTKEIEPGGLRAKFALHTKRNVGKGARPGGAMLPARGRQGFANAYCYLKDNYFRFNIEGGEIAKSKDKQQAFAKALELELQGVTNDMIQECNRQGFADGTGILALAAAAETDVGAVYHTIATHPYLWAVANKYLRNQDGLNLQVFDITAGANLPVDVDSYVTAKVDDSTTTDAVLGFDDGAGAHYTGWSGVAAGDGIGIFRAIQRVVSNAATQHEMMGLDGLIHHSNLPGDADWYYGDAPGVFTTQAWNNPEGAAADLAIASCTNELQGVDAAANTWWRSYVDGNGGTPRAWSNALLDRARNALQVENGATIDYIITTANVRQKYIDEMARDHRFVDQKKLDGFHVAMYDGIPIVVDKDCPRGRLYLIDKSAIVRFPGVRPQYIEQGGQALHWIPDYNAFEACLWMSENLAITDRTKCGKIIDVSEALS